MVKTDYITKKIQLRGMVIQLEQDREMEARLDKELEKILGRPCTMQDLEDLYNHDLKLLNQIEAGLNNKIAEFRTIIAAMWV